MGNEILYFWSENAIIVFSSFSPYNMEGLKFFLCCRRTLLCVDVSVCVCVCVWRLLACVGVCCEQGLYCCVCCVWRVAVVVRQMRMAYLCEIFSASSVHSKINFQLHIPRIIHITHTTH